MSRPKPKVLMSHTNPRSYLTEQVIVAKAIYAIFYDQKPITLKVVHSLLNNHVPKYRRTCFCESPGHATNLARRLNRLFKTDKFQVHELASVKAVSPTDKT
jgi:hypothetical protein